MKKGRSMSLAGARTLITGAGGGLGAAIARASAGRGAALVLSGRNAEALAPLAAETGAEVVTADLTTAGGVGHLLAAAGDVDILVSNAALPAAGEVGTFTVDEVDRALTVNLRAPIVISRCLGAAMASRRRGHIVFISSLAAAIPTPGLSVYNTTKSALSSYALSLRGELARHGVGVSVVCPGPIRDAGMWAETALSLPGGLGTRSPAQVGSAVVWAIEGDRAQVMVAPASLRVGAGLARAAPGLFARLAPRLGASRVTGAMAEALRHKR